MSRHGNIYKSLDKDYKSLKTQIMYMNKGFINKIIAIVCDLLSKHGDVMMLKTDDREIQSLYGLYPHSMPVKIIDGDDKTMIHLDRIFVIDGKVKLGEYGHNKIYTMGQLGLGDCMRIVGTVEKLLEKGE